MIRKCELGDCQNDAYLYVEMLDMNGNPDPMAVCFECYEEHGFKEYGV